MPDHQPRDTPGRPMPIYRRFLGPLIAVSFIAGTVAFVAGITNPCLRNSRNSVLQRHFWILVILLHHLPGGMGYHYIQGAASCAETPEQANLAKTPSLTYGKRERTSSLSADYGIFVSYPPPGRAQFCWPTGRQIAIVFRESVGVSRCRFHRGGDQLRDRDGVLSAKMQGRHRRHRQQMGVDRKSARNAKAATTPTTTSGWKSKRHSERKTPKIIPVLVEGASNA